MTKNQSILGQSWFMKFYGFFILFLLLLARFVYGQTQPTHDLRQAILHGIIQIHADQPVDHQIGKIQPGSSVKIAVTVENTGQQINPTGQIYVRYGFEYPLENEKKSIIFETEKKSLPSIEPGKKIEINFDTTHLFPSVLDFVRYDWSLREYQAIVAIQEKENMIGTLAVTLSAYYYPTYKSEYPTPI